MTIILVLWLLLLPGVGWADDCNTCRETGTYGIQECTLMNCSPPQPRDVCYQRMQEAMRSMEEEINALIGDNPKQPRIMLPILLKGNIWKSTMHACVKVTP